MSRHTSRPCPVHGCPELKPCDKHPERPRNASWSTDRDRTTQHQLRKATLQRDGYTCQRCGRHDPTGQSLDAHHDTPTHTTTLCNPCHTDVDPSARTRRTQTPTP